MRLVFIITLLISGFVEAQNTPLNSVFSPANSEQVKQVETFLFKNNKQQTRAIKLSRELRCPQCLNQNLMESNSPIAKDLRLVVYKMVDEGKTDDQIIEFMTQRFGDFVLYNPKFEPKTYLLWLGPLLLFLLFIIITIAVIRRDFKDTSQ